MKSENELLRYVEEQMKNNSNTIYVKLAYNTSCDQAIQNIQTKLMEVSMVAGETLLIRNSKCENQNTVMVVKNR